MKDKWLGHMVRITKNGEPWDGQRGEVVCRVHEGRRKIYIVQFPTDWNFFGAGEMRIDE